MPRLPQGDAAACTVINAQKDQHFEGHDGREGRTQPGLDAVALAGRLLASKVPHARFALLKPRAE